MSQQSNQKDGDSGPEMLSGRYEIQIDTPLPHLDSPLAKAYAVVDSRALSRSMFGLVCRLDLLPRLDIIPMFGRIRRIPVLSPIDAGTLPIPETDGRRFVIVFELPTGERVLAAPDRTVVPLREDQVVRCIVRPLLPALKEMAGRFIPHRAIRADNIFYTDASRKATMLGECVSAPPGMSQSVLYEPIEAAMSRPTGRGPGTVSDDLYAFGATLVVLLAGRNPVAEMSDVDLVESKIRNGSYSTLVGQMRVSLSMMEPLRGLLCDDPKERWTTADIELWLGGRQLSPKQPMLPTRASRAISFAGQDYWNRFSLSYAMGRDWSEARTILKNGELEGWVRRAYADEETADAIASAGGGESAKPERAVCRVLTVLQTRLPIRFKEIAARIEGLAQCFAAEYHDPEVRETFVELMRAKLPQMYLQSTPGTRTEQASLMKTFDMINYFVERPQIGNGLERALYESNRGWPCQSPLVKQDYVCEIEDLLPALDRAARRGASGDPMDRHIAAFCAARIRNLSERILRLLATPQDVAAYRRGTLQMLAEVQRLDDGQRKFTALTGWIGGSLEPVVEKFHNRGYRTQLTAAIERASKNGDILELQFLVDDSAAQTQDGNGFEKARVEYANLAHAIAWLEEGGLTAPAHVAEKGHQSATVISAVASGLLIVMLTLIYVI